MSAFLRKYATATHVYLPIIKRGVVDLAVGADWTPATGDVKVSIDGGAAANIGTLPTAIAMGNTAHWDFTIASGEVTGKKITITVSDSATKAVEDQCFLIETYGHASAEYAIDLTDGVRAGLTALPNAAANANGGLPVLSSSGTTLAYTISTLTTYTNNTPQTGDSYARIGATGSGLTSLAPASTALSSATWTNTRAGYLDNIDATVTSRLASVSYTAAPTANQNATALLDLADAITADMTVRDALRLIAAATAAGKTDGGGTDTFTIRNLEDTADAVTATVDADGNRSDITLDLS